MKKFKILIIAVCALLCACKANDISQPTLIDEPKYEIVDKTLDEDIPTASALELFWQDEEYTYYFPSIKSEYVEVVMEDGSIIKVTDALKDGLIKIDDLDRFNIGYYKYENTTENEEKSFYAKVIESNLASIIVEPYENEEIRKSSDRISIGLGEHNDCLYMVGTNLKITYSGYIMETYPAQIKATKIELKSVEKFNLVFYQKTMITPKQKEVILSKGEIFDVPNYNVYAFEGHVAINLNSDSDELIDGSMSLREALLQGKITMNEIIAKANKDLNEGKITGDMLKDGGTMIYKYDNYTIVKCHTIDGNRDVYIGGRDMKYSDLGI